MIVPMHGECHACFREIDDAVTSLVGANDRVYFNAHAAPHTVPSDRIVFNLENVAVQIPATIFVPRQQIWDFSARNVAYWRASGRNAIHVPVGFHPSMVRFSPKSGPERDIDVVFVGCLNPRRQAILSGLRERGLRVEALYGAYGAHRDAILARAKIMLNMLFYENGVFPILRHIHGAANRLVTVAEAATETAPWVHPEPVPYTSLVERIVELARAPIPTLDAIAIQAFDRVRANLLALPAVR